MSLNSALFGREHNHGMALCGIPTKDVDRKKNLRIEIYETYLVFLAKNY
jgi:hypothetical protein